MSQQNPWTMFYLVRNERGEVVYTGHSRMKKVSMARIEESERNWRGRNYGPSAFREALVTIGKNWTFHWLGTLTDATQDQAWEVMRQHIETMKPLYNVSKNPKASHETAIRYAA